MRRPSGAVQRDIAVFGGFRPDHRPGGVRLNGRENLVV